MNCVQTSRDENFRQNVHHHHQERSQTYDVSHCWQYKHRLEQEELQRRRVIEYTPYATQECRVRKTHHDKGGITMFEGYHVNHSPHNKPTNIISAPTDTLDLSNQRVMSQKEMQDFISTIKKVNQKHVSFGNVFRKLSNKIKNSQKQFHHNSKDTEGLEACYTVMNDSNCKKLEFPLEYENTTIKHFLDTRFKRRCAISESPKGREKYHIY